MRTFVPGTNPGTDRHEFVLAPTFARGIASFRLQDLSRLGGCLGLALDVPAASLCLSALTVRDGSNVGRRLCTLGRHCPCETGGSWNPKEQ